MDIIRTGLANDVPSGTPLGGPNIGWPELGIRELGKWMFPVIGLLIIGFSRRWPRRFNSRKVATTGLLACTFVGFYIMADSTVSPLTYSTWVYPWLSLFGKSNIPSVAALQVNFGIFFTGVVWSHPYDKRVL